MSLYTGGQGAKIAKYAAECGNLVTIRHFKNEFSSLGESTVRLFKKQEKLSDTGSNLWGINPCTPGTEIYLKTGVRCQSHLSHSMLINFLCMTVLCTSS